MPKPGSGGYAILIALYENEKSSDNSEGYLTKAQLQEASQNYCNESMTHTKPGKLLFRNFLDMKKNIITYIFFSYRDQSVLHSLEFLYNSDQKRTY